MDKRLYVVTSYEIVDWEYNLDKETDMPEYGNIVVGVFDNKALAEDARDRYSMFQLSVYGDEVLMDIKELTLNESIIDFSNLE